MIAHHRQTRTVLLKNPLLLLVLCALSGQVAHAQEATGGSSGSSGASGSSGNSSTDTGGTSDLGPQAPPPMAPLGGVLPHSGIDGGAPDLRDKLLSTYGQPVPNSHGPAWQFDPSISADAGYTDNAGTTSTTGSHDHLQGSAIFDLSPRIVITHQDEPFSVNINYAPTVRYFAQGGDSSQIAQNFNGGATITVWPGWFYTDLRGAITQQSAFGAQTQTAGGFIPNNQRQTVNSGSATPYFVHDVGDWGEVQVGYGYIYSSTDVPDAAKTEELQEQVRGNTEYIRYIPVNLLDTNLTTERGFASYTTGDILGRLQSRTSIDSNFYTGTGALAGADRITASDDLSYALNHGVALVGGGGYEDLDYPAIRFAYHGPIGSGGVTYTPNSHSSLTVQYRYNDGSGGLFVQGSMEVTARIRIFGGYSQGISTAEQDSQNALLTNSLSNSANSAGASAAQLAVSPLLDSGSSFGGADQVTRTKRADLSASWLLNRDTVSLSFSRDQTTPVGTQNPAEGEVGTAADSYSVNLGYHHQISETLSAYVSGSDSQSQSLVQGVSSFNSVGAGAGIDKSLNKQFSVYLHYQGQFPISGDNPLGRSNTVTIGLNKHFSGW